MEEINAIKQSCRYARLEYREFTECNIKWYLAVWIIAFSNSHCSLIENHKRSIMYFRIATLLMSYQ